MYECAMDKRLVKICIDEEQDWSATIYDIRGEKVGEVCFRLNDDDGQVLKLTWAYLDKPDGSYLHQGIGTAVLERVKAASGLQIVAEEDDGHRKDDGSHFTGDAAVWVAAMRRKRLIAPGQSCVTSDEDL
jgi:hypothetical protein